MAKLDIEQTVKNLAEKALDYVYKGKTIKEWAEEIYKYNANTEKKRERLTDPCWKVFDPWECCGLGEDCKRDAHEKGGCCNGCKVPKLYVRLAEYEDREEKGAEI